jgi:C-terminal processing protease CtpA/Prc
LSKSKILILLIFLMLLLAACGPTAEPAGEQAVDAADPMSEQVANTNEPVQVTGTVEVSNALIVEVYYFQRFAMLEDLTGFVQRDYEYEQPLKAQILGPVTVSEDGEFNFSINLPAMPISPFNDIDNDDQEDQGLQIWQVTMSANYFDDPFLNENETGGWSANYTSARIDSENKDEISGGMLLVWAADDQQEFSSGFGEDGLLFTADDPTTSVPAGYSFVDLDSEPFEFNKESVTELTLYEGELTVNDLSEMSWSEGFDALHNKISAEYPFTEMKALDWDALYAEFAPQIETAEANSDESAYFLALRDYGWSIPDGHVGLSFGDIGTQMFQDATGGGFGLAIIGLDDGRVIANILQEGGPADEAGMQWGAEILEWNGAPINEAVAEVVPWSMPFSNEVIKLIQQYRYLMRVPLGSDAEVTFQNPGDDEAITVSLTSVNESETFNATSFYAGFDANALPLEYEILPSGYGYIKLTSLSDDINLIIRLWEWAVERMISNQVPAIIVDMRQNGGGAPIGTVLASYFVQERIDFTRSYYYSEKSGEFETFRPPDYTEPDDKLYYDGQIAVLVGPACASACENVSYVLGKLPQGRVFGQYTTRSIYGEVARGQYLLPGGYSMQIPTGMDLDMEGNIVIEGIGVEPDVHVPISAETMKAQYVDGEDVVLDFAIEALNQPLGAGVAPDSPPKMGTVSEAETAFEAQTSWLDEFAQETYEEDELAQAGETYLYTVPINSSRDLLWVYPWCTADEETFEDNWSKISLEFSLNGEEIPVEDFAMLEGVFSGNHCRAYYTLLSDWAPGEHVIATTVTFSDALNDGVAEQDFPAGTHVYEYHVIVAR